MLDYATRAIVRQSAPAIRHARGVTSRFVQNCTLSVAARNHPTLDAR